MVLEVENITYAYKSQKEKEILKNVSIIDSNRKSLAVYFL